MLIGVTGGTGFVGHAVIDRLSRQDIRVVMAVRSGGRTLPRDWAAVNQIAIGEIDSRTDWSTALNGLDCVVHCAGQANSISPGFQSQGATFNTVNVDGTRRLAEQAAALGVKRFIYISSLKVNCEKTLPGKPVRIGDPEAPEGPYAISKWEAECTLAEISLTTGMEVVVIRPPLIYGPRVQGSFFQMLKWLHKGIPLPLGAIDNQRSFVSIDNLVALIVRCLTHPAAANRKFLVSDDDDMSTTQLLIRMARALETRSRLIKCSPFVICSAAKLIGKSGIGHRLTDNLVLDMSSTKQQLGWTPPFTVEESLKKTAHWYLENQIS